jgi:3-ketosteroid 9alpha-monooxygenase subunit B
VTTVTGEVEMEVNDVLEPDDLAEGLILACQARPLSDSVEISYD